MRTRQKCVATDTWRSLWCRTTPPEHRSRRKPTAEPRRAKQQTKKLRPKPTKTNSPTPGPPPSPTPDPPARNQRGKQSHQPRLGQTPSTQTVALHPCHTQHALNERQSLRTDQKNQPHLQPPRTTHQATTKPRLRQPRCKSAPNPTPNPETNPQCRRQNPEKVFRSP